MAYIHRHSERIVMSISQEGTNPFKFGDKELDKMHGLNQYDFHARQYDPPTGRFTTVDPMAEKYYSISPYAYCANNPIRNIDINGDSITVANDEASRNDIASIVNKKNRGYISYDENGNMSLNFGDMSQKEINKVLGKDKGLSLLNNMINAKFANNGDGMKFFYATTNERKGYNMETKESFSIVLNRPEGTVTTNDNGFATNLSHTLTGLGTIPLIPEKGYDGTVRISPGTMYNIKERYEYIVPRKDLIFHELHESYLRTHGGMPYIEAHKKAGGAGNYSKFRWGN